MINQINEHTTKTKKPATKLARDFDYGMVFSHRQIPVTDAFLEKLAFEYVEWVLTNESALTQDSFLVHKRLNWITWDAWCKRSAPLAEARAFAKAVIGHRRETGGLTKKYDAGLVSKSMPMYSDAWVKLGEWYAKLKEDQVQVAGNFKVVMPAIEKPKE